MTSESDDLTAADISVSISVVEQLTQEATTNIVVSISNLTDSYSAHDNLWDARI